MTDIDITLNAWEQNYVPVLAVQGESEGRTINAALVDRTGQTDGSFNAASVDRPIDLTGTTVRLYCKKPDGTQTLSDGTITDATNGKASFVLPQQATAAVGNVSAQIYITKPDNSVLKVIGLTLVVQESDLDSIESSDEFDSLVKALNGVEKVSADAQTAVDNANTAISTVTANEDTRQGNESTRQANETTRQSQETTRQSNESRRKTAETSRTDAETTRESNESARKTAEQARAAAEESRVTAENKRQTDTEVAISSADTATSGANSAASAASTAADNANHVPQYGDNGNWESWNGTAYADAGKPWKGEKGDTGEKGDKGDKGDPFEYSKSYDTLSALESAYPSGDSKGHLVGEVAYIWNGSAWEATSVDLTGYQKTTDADKKYVPQTRTILDLPLSANITLAQLIAKGIASGDGSGKAENAVNADNAGNALELDGTPAADIIDPGHSFGPSGYTALPNGLILEWITGSTGYVMGGNRYNEILQPQTITDPMFVIGKMVPDDRNIGSEYKEEVALNKHGEIELSAYPESADINFDYFVLTIGTREDK